MTYTVMSREVVWPGQVPTNSTGSPRPLLQPHRPWYTIHYTGGGLWLDPDDSPTELRSIQSYAQSAGKPWEYNWVIDGQGIIWEYAGDYQAAHSGGENDKAIGVLLLVGFKGQYPNVEYWEHPPTAMITAVRQLRAVLVERGMLATDHSMLPHKKMPDAATVCPGDAVMAAWSLLTAPWVLPPTDPGDDDMSAATLWRPQGYINVFLIGEGPAINVSGETYASLMARGIPYIDGEDHPQMLKTCLFQAGLTEADLVEGGAP